MPQGWRDRWGFRTRGGEDVMGYIVIKLGCAPNGGKGAKHFQSLAMIGKWAQWGIAGKKVTTSLSRRKRLAEEKDGKKTS